MTVKEIRQLIRGLPDNTEVVVVDIENHTRPITLGGREFTITTEKTSVRVWLEL